MLSKKSASGLGLLSLIVAVGCGGGGSIVLPNPNGSFSNASLKGSYVFYVHGFDATNGNPYRETGVFVADGNGNLTGGMDDSSFSAAGTAITGSYSIGKDGTGFVGLNTSSVGQVTFAITMVSSSRAYLIEADNFANGAGVAELQDPNAIASGPSGNFVFRLHEEISAETGAPSAEVGAVAISGTLGAGSMDENLAGTFTSPNVTMTVNAPGSFGRGTGSLVNTNASFTTHFVYYIVDATKMQILVSDVGAVGSGSAEMQSGNVSAGLSGNYAFGSRGDDLNATSGFFAGISTVGEFSAAFGVMTGTLDNSVEGTIASNANFSSCYTAFASGRVVVQTASGGTCSGTTSQVFWMVSPSRAFFVNLDPGFVEDGSADLQTSTSFTNATFKGQYALAMDGLDLSQLFNFGAQLLSRVGTLQFDGTGKLTLNEAANSSLTGAGAQSPGVLSGSYSTGTNGRVTGTLNGGSLNVVIYPVSASQGYILQTDPGLVTSGSLQLQP